MEQYFFKTNEDLIVSTEALDMHSYRRTAFAKEGCFCFGGGLGDIRFDGIEDNEDGTGRMLSPYLETKLKGLTKDEVYDMSIDILYGYAKDAQLIVNPVEENNYDYQY
jgi:hypothetical protein